LMRPRTVMRRITVWVGSKLARFTSTAPISAVGPGGDEERDMIRHGGVGNSESDRDAVEKTRFGQRSAFADEIIADVTHHCVLRDTQLVCSEQRLICAAIGIGADSFEEPGFLGVEKPELDLHALSRTSMCGVEDVSAEPGGHEQSNSSEQRGSRSV